MAPKNCRVIEPFRPHFVEDPLREKQFARKIPKRRLLNSVPPAPGEQWGQRWKSGQVVMEFNDGTTMPPHITQFVEFRDGGAGSKDVATGYPPAASCKLARAI